MVSIELIGVKFVAFHGIYESENKVGIPYEVNLMVKYNEENIQFDDIKNTINYVDLFQLLKKRMLINTPLLEKLCEGIIRKIKHQYPFSKEIFLSVYKLEAPIEGFQGKVGVSLHKIY